MYAPLAPTPPTFRPPPATSLVVEDHLPAAQSLCDCLEGEGHAVDFAADGPTALHQLAREDYDLVLLNIGLPGMDGYEVLRRMREQLRLPTPVLLMTARDGLADKLRGFACGADDFMIKPLALPEVAVRARALIRRSRQLAEHAFTLEHGPLVYRPAERRLTLRGQTVALPRMSRMLLELLLRHGDRPVPRQALEQYLWHGDPPMSESLRAHVYLLRKALRRHGFQGIETCRGIGWRLAPAAADN